MFISVEKYESKEDRVNKLCSFHQRDAPYILAHWGTQICVFYLLVIGDRGRRYAFFAHVSLRALSVLC
jgi:hypothetical protein